jgi:hypothetical protein
VFAPAFFLYAGGEFYMFRTDNKSGQRAFDLATRYCHWLPRSLATLIFMTVLTPGFNSHSAWAANAQSGGEIKPCITALLFAPGPIVNGHHRQPTQAEIEERTWELSAKKASGDSCR